MRGAIGAYNARSEGYYGFSEVTINVPGGAGGTPGGPGSSVTGRDGDGDDAVTRVTPTGELVTTKVPSSIKVETPPSKTRYNDGDAIDFNGMIVKAYLRTGAVFSDSTYPNGVVPNSQLTLPVTTADYTSGIEYEATSDLETGMTQPIHYAMGTQVSTAATSRDFTETTYECDGDVKCFVVLYDGFARRLYGFAATHEFTVTVVSTTKPKSSPDATGTTTTTTHTFSPYTPDWAAVGATVHLVQIAVVSPKETEYSTTFPQNEGTPTMTDYWVIAYSVYDNSRQSIPVQWNSPYDGKTMESEFDITVVNT